MCRAVVLFQVAECAQTTPMIAPLPGDPNKKNFFSLDGSVAFFKSGESNPTQPNLTPPPPAPKVWRDSLLHGVGTVIGITMGDQREHLALGCRVMNNGRILVGPLQP